MLGIILVAVVTIVSRGVVAQICNNCKIFYLL